ncbi:MAG TPA: cyanophycinase [Gemmatimonadaceae bacterium]|nr:cyanophycinase [Gemmatimonadaceae bacterium]
MTGRVSAIAAVALIAASAAPATRALAPSARKNAPRGTLFIVGGGSQSPALVDEFISLAGGRGRARIAVVPMASSDAEGSGEEKADELREHGAAAFVLLVTTEQANRDSVVHLLDSATGIWFSGGDQLRLARVLRGTATLAAMHRRYDAGAVVGGTSAGAAVMSDSMITGNQTRPDSDHVGYYGEDFPTVARHTIEVVPGFAFLPRTVVDQHFLRRQRENRLLAVILERPSLIGVGIDEGTALRVDPDGIWRVVGASAVEIYDAHASRVTSASAGTLGAVDVRLHLLPAGSSYDPRTRRATLPGK